MALWLPVLLRAAVLALWPCAMALLAGASAAVAAWLFWRAVRDRAPALLVPALAEAGFAWCAARLAVLGAAG